MFSRLCITPYSVLMALLWFTAAALLGCLMLRKAEKHGLTFIALVFLLALLRGVLPLESSMSVVIRSEKIYPMARGLLSAPVCGDLTLGACLLIVAGAGTVFQLFRFLWRIIRQAGFLRAAPSEPENSRFFPLFREVCDEFGYRGAARLTVSPEVPTALQAGFWSVHIVLPPDAAGFSDRDLRNILRHELCHFLGGDMWINAGIQLAACFLWWNPVVYLLKRRVVQLLELACDRRVCKRLSGDGQLEYLETLLSFTKGKHGESSNMALSYLGNAGEAELRQRFRLVLQGRPAWRTRIRFWGCSVLCAVVFVASYFVILQPAWMPSILSDPSESAVASFDSTEGFILQESDGTYRFYQNGKFQWCLSERDLEEEPYKNFQIYSGGDGK